MSVALGDSSAWDKMHESVEFAERNRADVAAVSASVRRRVERHLARLAAARGVAPPAAREVSLATDAKLESDKYVKLAVANEQWGGRLATTYALVELAETQRAVYGVLLEVRRLLTRVADAVDPPPGGVSRG